MNSTSPLRARVSVVAAILAALTVNVAGFFPGHAVWDSQFQWDEAAAGRYTDWHPPIMARFVALLQYIKAGYAPLFSIQVAIYWIAIGLFAWSLIVGGRRRAAWAVLVVGLLPTFLILNSLLVKDVGMSVSLLAAAAIVFHYRSAGRSVPLVPRCLVAVLLVYAVLVRVNAIFAAAPLFIYLAAPQWRQRPVVLAAAWAAIVLVVIGSLGLINHRVLGALPTHPERSLEVYDIEGIAYFSRDLSVFGPDTALTAREVHHCYSPATWDSLAPLAKCHQFWDALGSLPGEPDDHTIDGRFWYESPPNPELHRLWLQAVLRHPVAYVRHRIAHFNSAVGFVVQRNHADRRVLDRVAYGMPIPAGTEDLFAKLSGANAIVTPAVAIALGLALLLHIGFSAPVGRFDPWREAAFFLTVSGLLYSAGFLVVGVSSDLRYQFWTMLSIFSAAAISMPAGPWRNRHFSRRDWAGVGLLTGVLVVGTAARMWSGDALELLASHDASPTWADTAGEHAAADGRTYLR